VWPQAGVALACLIVFGLRTWPGIAIGAFLITLGIYHAPATALALAAATTLGTVIAYAILCRAKFCLSLERLRDALALAFAALLAAINASVVVNSGLRPDETFSTRALIVWMSSATGVLVFTPMLLVLRRIRWPRNVQPKRVLEAFGIAVCTAAAMYFETSTTSELLFLAFPVIIWAAVRFQLAGAAPCAVVFSFMAIYAAATGLGPFGASDVAADVITVQAFNSAVALTALVLAVTITERDHAHREIKQAVGQLAALVDQLDHRLRPNLSGQPRQPLEPASPPPL
jgi:integral membrane sensor domain MASE1